MKYVQHTRGKWKVRMTAPDELRAIIGQRELVDNDLPNDARTREKLATAIINRFLARIDEARELFELQKSTPSVALSIAAKKHYHQEIAVDEQKRAALPTIAEIEVEKERALARLADDQREGRQTFTSIFNATTDFELKAGAREFYHNNRTRRLAALRSSFSSGDFRWIEPVVQQYITRSFSTP